MKDKKLLIVENCSSKLNFEQDNDTIILSGLFTTFCTKNRNGRIYESADFLPHVEALKEQMASNTLLGELDHPHSFETTLSNVSHVVESLEFDPQQNAIVGRVRLLNTSKGKEAQALVRDGIPLHISSRAAGTVDESGRVRLQQLFTYDLVAEPGFANARLKRVNESYGFSNDDDFAIFDLSEGAINTELKPEPAAEGARAESAAVAQVELNKEVATTGTTMDNTNKSKNNMENKEFISYADFQRYSEHLSEIITDLQSAIANYKTDLTNLKNDRPTMHFDADNVDNTAITDMIAKEVESQVAQKVAPAESCPDCDNAELAAKAKAMEEKYANLEKYVGYLAENLDKAITHQDYIAEEANKIIGHNNYLAENMNKMIEHQDYIAENLNDTIGYQEYVAEMLDKSIDYSNMLAEEQNKSVAHQDYLVEKMNQMVAHQDYLAENLENSIKHNDYIVEEINKGNLFTNVVEEKKETVETPAETTETAPVNESVEVKAPVEKFDSKKYQSEISERLSALISDVKTQYEETKRLEAEALEESKNKVEDPTNFSLINHIPARLQERWTKLSDERKQEILAESKMFVITSPSSAEYFWNTRDMREKQIEIKKVAENVTAQSAPAVNESVLNDDRMKAMAEMIKKRMRTF